MQECEARGAQQSYSAINRVIFPRNAKHRKRLSSKNTEVKAKAVFSRCAGLRTARPRVHGATEFTILVRSFRARGVERVCGIPAESGHPPADQGNDPADRTYIMQRTIATLEIRFTRLRLSQGVVGQAFPGHLKSKAPRTIDGERCGKR